MIIICSLCYSGNQTNVNPFSQNMNNSFAQHKMTDELTFNNVVPTVSTSASVPAASLPDPSKFFDTIGPEPQIMPSKSGITNTTILTEAMDGLSIKVSCTLTSLFVANQARNCKGF